jgi:hypothetical protein
MMANLTRTQVKKIALSPFSIVKGYRGHFLGHREYGVRTFIISKSIRVIHGLLISSVQKT